MWIGSTDTLRGEIVGVIAEVFAESRKKPPAIARQIRERLKQHSLLVTTSPSNSLSFDHEDFRSYYLGEALGRALVRDDLGELKGLLQVASLPQGCVEQATLFLQISHVPSNKVLKLLQRMVNLELTTSFVRENAGILTLRFLDGADLGAMTLSDMNFPLDALNGINLKNIRFQSSYFQPTSLVGTTLQNCAFTKCRFERLEVSSRKNISASFENCEIGSLLRKDLDIQLFDPRQIASALSEYGIKVSSGLKQGQPSVPSKPDEESILVEKALRAFLHSTQINDSVFRTRMGEKANKFMKIVLPDLIRVGILEEVQFTGGGVQRRFRFRAQMTQVQEALAKSSGKYKDFLASFRP
jgi:hypothetical protein